MSRALTKYRGTGLSNQTTIIIGLIVAGIIVYLLLKNRPAQASSQYSNAETWDVLWNEDGLPVKVTIHRDARQGALGSTINPLQLGIGK